MRIEYILVLKENKRNKTIPRIQVILQNKFESVTLNSFELIYKKQKYVIDYRFYIHTVDTKKYDIKDRTIYYLTLSYGTSQNEETASILDEAHRCFKETINRYEHNFHITISYDERASYFCSRAYPYFGKFEAKLRCLILEMLTHMFGYLWPQITLSSDLRNTIKSKTGNQLESIAAEALYEMDYNMLIIFLFEKTRDVELSELIDNDFSSETLKNLDIEEIIEKIEMARPRSNWERYFANEVIIDDLESTLSVIQKQRNKVAHFKHYFKSDFDQDKKTLSSLCDKLDEAINSIKAGNITMAIELIYKVFKGYLALLLLKNTISNSICEWNEKYSETHDATPIRNYFTHIQKNIKTTDFSTIILHQYKSEEKISDKLRTVLSEIKRGELNE